MENSKKTIYLHIGMPKTGSTSIQNFLYLNREALEKNNLFYPVIFEDSAKGNAKFINYRHIIISHMAEIGRNKFANYNKFFEKNYLPLIENSKCDKIVLSDEIIWDLGGFAPNICDIMLKHGFNVKIIAYIRKPVEYLASKWQERLKPFNLDLRPQCSLNEFLDKQNPSYGVIERYADKLGKENIILRPFEKEQWKNEDLFEDFLDIFGMEMISNPVIKRTNESPLNRNAAKFMLLLRSASSTQHQFTCYLQEYADTLLPPDEQLEYQYKYRLKREQALKIIEKYQPQSPKIVDTVPEDKMIEIAQKYKPILTKLASYSGKKSLFINELPSTKRTPYTKTEFTFEQLEIIRKALLNQNKNRYKFRGYKKAYNEMAMGRELPTFWEKVFSKRLEGNGKAMYILGLRIKLR